MEVDSPLFLPLGRSLALSSASGGEGGEESRLDRLLGQVHQLTERMRREEAEKARAAEKERQRRWWKEQRVSRHPRPGSDSIIPNSPLLASLERPDEMATTGLEWMRAFVLWRLI